MKLLKFSIFLSLFSLLKSSILTAQIKMEKVTVIGNRFVNSSGKSLILKGLNTSDPTKLSKEGHWNLEYFQEMKNWGANIARFPVHPSAFRKIGEEKYLKLLDEGVEMAEKMGIYVIIDWHSIGNLQTEMFQNESYKTTKKETYEFWQLMANHFKGNNTVAFFEIFNEPTTQNEQLGSCSWAQWKEINEDVIKIIRASGCKAIPLVAGFDWAYDLTPIKTDPIKAEGIGYVSHPYPMKQDKPWEEKWTKDWGYVAEKYPLILTEIGFCAKENVGAHIPVIDDGAYGDAITNYAKNKNISWLVWVFDNQWAPRMFNNWSFEPSRQGKYFRKILQGTK